MKRVQEILTMLAVVCGSCGAIVFSQTGHGVLFGVNHTLIYAFLIVSLVSAVGAMALSFLR